MVFQDPYASLDPRMTVGASVAEAMLGERDRRLREREVARLLELVGLEAARAVERPATLSGGQRQRVALARALAARPRVIIADEITSALDASVQGSVLNTLRDLQSQLGLTVVFITHNLAVVRYIADHVAVMQHGRIVEQGPVLDVMHAPQHEYTRLLLEAVPQAP
jgi:peptide/nickel transport system ATP-binding protein